MKRSRGWFGGVATLALLSLGCGGTVRMPNLFHPGTAGQQRTEAIYHDPYPLEDAGPADAGFRPQEYNRSVPEVTRSRLSTPRSRVPGY